MVGCNDKGRGSYSYYLEKAFALYIDSFTFGEAGYIKSWDLMGPDFLLHGEDVNKLVDVLKWFISNYNLKSISDHSKSIAVIYVDNLNKIRGFLNKYINFDFKFYVQVFDYIEFRPIDIWTKSFENVKDIYNKANLMIENIFIPDKYFYLTPNQIPRKRIKKVCKDNSITLAKQLTNIRYYDYIKLKKSLFGGFYYMPNRGITIDTPMIGLDLTSAYIYCLLIEKHCCSKPKSVNPNKWKDYIDNEDYASVGTYCIEYSTKSDKLICYKDIFGNSLEKGKCKHIIRLNNIDLGIIISLVDSINITCTELEEYKLDYLPKPIMDIIVDEYVKKNVMKNNNDPNTDIQKATVNGIYGDTIRNIDSEEEWISKKKDLVLAPIWGCFTTSYCKKLLLSLATKVEGWQLSATDSVYCYDNEFNRNKLKDVNDYIVSRVKNYCDMFNYNFNDLEKLGTFKVEAEIVKFKAFRYGNYAYTCVDGHMVVKASGCNKKDIVVDDSIYDLNEIPIGSIAYPRICLEHSECEYEGKHYESDTSYYEHFTNSEVLSKISLILYSL